MPNEINKQVVADVYTQTDQLKNEVIEINKSLDDLLKRQKDLKAAGEQNSKSYQDVAAQIRLAKDAIKQTTEQIDANIKALNLSKNSLQQNKALLEALTSQYEKLTQSQGDNSKEAKALNNQIGTLTNAITHQEEKLAKSRNVFDKYAETNKAFSSSFDKLKISAGELNLGETLSSASDGFNVMKSGLSAVKTGFQSVGGAIKTTGFGLLLLVLESIIQYFTGTTEGAKKLKAILSAVSTVVKVFKEGLSNLGKILIDAFSNPVDSIKKLGQLLVDNVINRFKALLVIWDGVRHLDFKKISNGVLQAATGVTNLADKVTKAYDDINKPEEHYEKKVANHHQNQKKRHQERMQMHQEETNASKVKLPIPEAARPATEALEAKSINFAETIKLDKQQYDEELALLDDQLKSKLISRETYQQQTQQLEEKYHLAIGDKVKEFHKIDLAEAQKHMQDMVTIEQHDSVMADDEHKLKKAILPGDKLEAEKKLIADKFNYEIALAAGNTEKIKQLEIQKQESLTAITKQYEQQRKDLAMQAAQQVSNTAFSMLKGSIQAANAEKIKGLETQKQAELKNSSLTATQKHSIEDKYKKKEADEKVKAFKAEQKASMLQAVINGALAITKATSQTGILAPFVIPGIILTTALQVATIAKQKPPQYAKGGVHYQSDGRGALLSGYSRTDDTNAYLRSGEAVVVSEAMRNPWARNLVSAINVAHGGRDFSITNPGKGYAIGGVFTDGGNANRYYNQPVTDAKDLANTLAYQMINNFPPIYVDVKDVNNQQNILAQTVNRVIL